MNFKWFDASFPQAAHVRSTRRNKFPSKILSEIILNCAIEIIKKITTTIKQMCIGEINQNFDRFKIGTIEDYNEKTKNKTKLRDIENHQEIGLGKMDKRGQKLQTSRYRIKK